ncbi:hypothetical protein GCM10010912_07200 [Paenibacillus albidus]|uniref:Uncharacterized protein n=1 Tax=Paenibacillus albidus TaxID=2041023 RepID=A0A917C128_9BACL|nr:hypothetical protein [Paenibacillus albidus]GGF64785.1 hypothetical protein GCM10010912_07200 [Paenibacillus albidus]
MNKILKSEIPSVRLTSGLYALSKLACAGITFLLLSLLVLFLPDMIGWPEEWPVSAAYAIYAYGLPAALVADLFLRLLRSSSLVLAFLLYAAAGAGAGLWIEAEQGGTLLVSVVAGTLLLLVFRAALILVERLPLLVPVFALFIPLLCLLLFT